MTYMYQCIIALYYTLHKLVLKSSVHLCSLLILPVVIIGNAQLVIHMEISSRNGLQTFREHVLVNFSIVELLFDLSVTYPRECRALSAVWSSVEKIKLATHEGGTYQKEMPFGLTYSRGKFRLWETELYSPRKVKSQFSECAFI